MTIPNSLNPLKVPDFNADGRTDLFSFNPVTRIPEISLLAGARSTSSGSFFFIPDGWQDPKYGDFNGDGKTDLFWRNSKTGENAIWLMDGTGYSQAEFIDSLQGSWTETVGDFDGDGKSDLFWYNASTGEFQIWVMNGVQRVRQSSSKIDRGWESAIADFNNDNRTDLFWRNSQTGQNAIWTIDPGTLAVTGEYIESKPQNWRYEVIDYNGDGRSDIFWRDRLTGRNQIWITSSNSIQPTPIPIDLPGAGGDFVIKTADFDGNGKTDFLVRNPSTGENQVWRAGDIEVQISNISPQSGLFQPQIGDYNGDRFSDIRWTSVVGKDSVTWFSDGVLPRPMVMV
jgi:FG-GAP-like repeat